MSDFKAKMHQNPISSGTLPQTSLGSLQRSPSQTYQLDLRQPTSKGGNGREESGWEGRKG